MRSSIVTAFLIALAASTVLAATLYARPAQGADAGPPAGVQSKPALLPSPTPATSASPTAPPGPAPAAVTTPAPADPVAFLGSLATAAKQGAWLTLAALLLGALVSLIRREKGWLATKWTWLATDRGGAVLALVLGALGETVARLTAGGSGAPPGTVAALVTALAAGGRALLQGLFTPADQKPATPVAT